MTKRVEAGLLAISCSMALILSWVSSVHAKTAQEIAKTAFGSTVLLVMEDSNGLPLSLGSGFVIREGTIASNLHVVEGAARGYAKIVGQETKYRIEGIVATDAQRDLVVLKIPEVSAPTLPIGNSDEVQVGDSVYAVGNPQGLEGTFSQGIVSGIRMRGADNLLQVTAPISPGSSGGPVLSQTGEVIGVSVATFKGGQNLNFAIPANYLKALLTKVGAVTPLADARSTDARRSFMPDLGGPVADGVVASHFRWSDSASGYYTFSVRNNLVNAIHAVDCLVIFYGDDGLPIETERHVFEDTIGEQLAVRSARFGRRNADEVKSLARRTEVRILNFKPGKRASWIHYRTEGSRVIKYEEQDE